MVFCAGGSGNTGRAGWLGYVSGELGDDWPVTELEGALACLAGESRETGRSLFIAMSASAGHAIVLRFLLDPI
eukprot:COSAG02_NODE_1003_length_15280_cov_57.673803_9_plen_73_part_00